MKEDQEQLPDEPVPYWPAYLPVPRLGTWIIYQTGSDEPTFREAR
jgi:hypothetical protein